MILVFKFDKILFSDMSSWYNSISMLLFPGKINISIPNHKNDKISIGRV